MRITVQQNHLPQLTKIQNFLDESFKILGIIVNMGYQVKAARVNITKKKTKQNKTKQKNKFHNKYYKIHSKMEILSFLKKWTKCPKDSCASWMQKYSTFLDQLGLQNALQNLSSLTDQLKMSYLQHCGIQLNIKNTSPQQENGSQTQSAKETYVISLEVQTLLSKSLLLSPQKQ